MNRSLFFLLVTLLSISANAQINELGIFAGGSNYIGDIGPTNYIAPQDPAIGIIYKWNRSPRHSWRASFSYAKISSDDADSEISGRQQRGLSFTNTVKELSAGMEFSFFEFNLHEHDFKVTPYVYGGLSYFWFDDKYFVNGITVHDNTKEQARLAIPMVVGIKAHITRDLILGAEVGLRYTFSDNLDGSNPEKDNEVYSFANRDSKDWYVFSGFTLTYTFTDKPCYCGD